jgi:hypothetical protein
MSRRWKIAVVIVLLSGFIGCNRQDRLQNEVIMLQDRTIPPDAKRIERLELIRNKHGATAAWSFESDRDWSAYTTWLIGNLPTYTPESTGPVLRLVRRLPGDAFELRVEGSLAKDVIVARVNFRAVAQ